MNRAYPYMPGVPAAGHITGGAWHPGAISSCRRCTPAEPERPGWRLGRGARVYWDGVFPNPKRTGTVLRTGTIRYEVLWDGETKPELVSPNFLARVKP